MLQSSSAPVIFLLGNFFPSAFYAEIQAPGFLVLSQHPAVGFVWIAATLTNSRLMLDEKHNLHCWLSPVTDTWRGLGWNFVLKNILLLCVDTPGKAEPALLPLLCVNKDLLKQIPVPTIFLRLSKAANRGTSGTQGIFFPAALGVSHSHLFPF